MEAVGHSRKSQPDRRLLLPAYHVSDAARYVGVSISTIHHWQRAAHELKPVLANRDSRESLSFLQLVELRFVSAMRAAGIPLKKIRLAREYLAADFNTDFPFADLRLKHDGQDILLDLGAEYSGRLLVANRGGQYVWKEIIGNKFDEFDYVDLQARRWHVAGKESPILIDPEIAFGAPQIRGVPTWALKNRHDSGESSAEISRDFKIPRKLVKDALEFERLKDKNIRKSKAWTH